MKIQSWNKYINIQYSEYPDRKCCKVFSNQQRLLFLHDNSKISKEHREIYNFIFIVNFSLSVSLVPSNNIH